ncbi:MAG: MG2 domain-containing protein, partial [Thermoanaerobaculia bacterium]|nr:MG2 domain-containing protein [Thermoanaerobaculia bacterium]
MTHARSLTATIIVLALLALAVPGFTASVQTELTRPTAPGTEQADELYEEGSYRLAHQAYEKVDLAELGEVGQRWVLFRRADSLWRAESSDPQRDPSKMEQARRELRELLEAYEREEERDRLFAEIHESLGDSYWSEATHSWSAAWQHYRQALEWWAGSTNLDLARDQYIEIVRKASDPPQRHHQRSYGTWAQSIPVAILENVVEIAKSPDDRAFANYLLALHLRYASEPRLVERSIEAFETAIEEGRGTEWHDDALLAYAQSLEQRGNLVFRNGRWRLRPDPEGALTLYRRLTSLYAKGQTRYYDQAISRIREITEPSLDLTVSNVFLPGSKLAYQIHWRNIGSTEIELWKVDLTRELRFENDRSGEWIQRISLDRAERIDSKKRTLQSDGPYLPGSETVRIERQLPVGAYLISARSGDLEARELILVTDVAIVTKTSPDQILVFLTDANSGEPIRDARVRAWEEYHDHNRVRNRSYDSITGSDGVAMISRTGNATGRQILVTANRDGHQAFAVAWASGSRHRSDEWRIYAETDRPAYRPEETVHWKITARTMFDDEYSTPAGRKIEYEIYDPRGNKTSDGVLTLNDFGSGWSEIELDETMPLGLYTIRFETPAKGSIGSATLFRLEEYKLPEFRVSVEPVSSDDRASKLVRLGDEVEVEIEAEYYFGGPVANAAVDVVVHQKPYYPDWRWPRPYPWYFEQP